MSEEEAFAFEQPIGMAVMASADSKEGPKAFAEKRTPELPAEVRPIRSHGLRCWSAQASRDQRFDDPAEALDAVTLMTTAVERAGADAHAPRCSRRRRPCTSREGRGATATPVGSSPSASAPSARTVIAELGVLQSTPFTRACRAIAGGDLDVAIVVGGEAKFRDLRGHITGVTPVDSAQDTDAAPDESIKPADEIIPAPERAAGS